MFKAQTRANNAPVVPSPPVVLLHGLAHTSRSMTPVATALQANGRAVINVDYASRRHTIAELAELAMRTAFAALDGQPEEFDVVTHSMGGILLRQYAARRTAHRTHRAVMLALPHQGSELVDALRPVPGFRFCNGAAGLALGTDECSAPSALGPLKFSTGIIAGSFSPNPLFARLLPRPNDGKVSVASTRVDGMADCVTVHRGHKLIMRAPEVLQHIENFLRFGQFKH